MVKIEGTNLSFYATINSDKDVSTTFSTDSYKTFLETFGILKNEFFHAVGERGTKVDVVSCYFSNSVYVFSDSAWRNVSPNKYTVTGKR